MNADRKYFYELVDKIPEAKLSELRMLLLKMAIPEVEPTEEEIEAIKRGKEQYEKGEYVSFKNLEEMERYFMSEDDAEDEKEHIKHSEVFDEVNFPE